MGVRLRFMSSANRFNAGKPRSILGRVIIRVLTFFLIEDQLHWDIARQVPNKFHTLQVARFHKSNNLIGC
jgi:hypothetical protein